MMRTLLGGLLLALLVAPQANAASFACSKATTPFEHAICDNPALSAADEVLAKGFATATGGLTKPAVTAMRADQRNWLDFAAKSCTDNGELLADGAQYNSDQVDCLTAAFTSRMGTLEGSRMLGGHRFALSSRYATLPDPDAANDPDYYWKVATHALSFPQLDADDALAAKFNAFVEGAAAEQSSLLASGGDIDLDAQSDTDVAITVATVSDNRITLAARTYWFGHGAAHGNSGLSYLHYLPQQQRALEASDVFTGEGWQQKLLDLSVAELKKEHGDNLMLDKPEDIAAAVADPSRWSFDSDYGLTIQFQQYEVAAYAYGMPTILIPWESLAELTAPDVDAVRY